MTNRNTYYASNHEARKVVARNTELPQCEGLRACAALTSIIQFFLISKTCPWFDLTIAVQIGFGLIGFMVAAYLLRDRDLTTDGVVYDAEGIVASLRRLVGTLPLPQMAVVVIAVLLLPTIFQIEGTTVPDVSEVPAIIVRIFANYFSDFQRSGFDGRTLMLFPLVILFAPRRLLSLVLLTVLGSGLVLQFSGLFAGSIRPASILTAPSAFDLLALGTFLAVIARQRRIGRSEAQIGLSAVVAGLIVAAGLVGARLQGVGSGLGSITLFSAPQGFGVVNFIFEIVGTTLVSSLWWRDLGGMMDRVDRVPAH